MATPTSVVLTGENPFDVVPALDVPAAPDRDVDGWSETYYFSVWSPAQSVGVFIHAGTSPHDQDLWWAQVFAYLPEGRVAASMSWSRGRMSDGFSTGNFIARCDEPLRKWVLQFDGAGELVTSATMAQRLVGAGPSLPMSFEFELEAVGPVWDLYKASGVPAQDFGDVHHEQTMASRGTLSVNKQTWLINDGAAYRDHSFGRRSFADIAGDCMWGLVSDNGKRSVQGLTVWSRSGERLLNTVAIHEDTVLELGSDVTMTRSVDTAGNPSEVEMTIVRASGERLVCKGERLHCATMSIADPNSNVNGALLDGDPLILAECPVRFTWPDGDIMHGHLERSWRLSGLRVS